MSDPSHTDSDALADTVTRVIDTLRHKPGALLPILHAIQDELGYIPATAVAPIASALRQTRAEIHGVISFYHDFRTDPPARHRIQICRAEACQARGARALETHAKQQLGIDYHQTSADREFSLAPVYCLGNCACGPSVRIDSSIDNNTDNNSGPNIVGRVDAGRFDQLLEQLTTIAVEVQS